MAAELALNIKASIDWLFKDALDLSTVNDAAKAEYSQSIATGTGSGLADKIWHDARTLTAGSADNLDLTALTQSIFGSTVSYAFVKVKGIWLRNMNTLSGDDLVIGNGTNPFNPGLSAGTATLTAYANSVLMLQNYYAGWTVTNGSADVLKINNGTANSITYRIAIWGTSA